MKNKPVLAAAIFGLTLIASSASAQNPQELFNSVETVIEQSVGANIDNQIPGYNYSDDHLTLQTGGIECPKAVSDVKQAIDLLRANLTSSFTNRIAGIRARRFPPGSDTVMTVKLHDQSQDVTVSITIFKRPSSPVFLFPVMFARPADQ